MICLEWFIDQIIFFCLELYHKIGILKRTAVNIINERKWNNLKEMELKIKICLIL